MKCKVGDIVHLNCTDFRSPRTVTVVHSDHYTLSYENSKRSSSLRWFEEEVVLIKRKNSKTMKLMRKLLK